MVPIEHLAPAVATVQEQVNKRAAPASMVAPKTMKEPAVAHVKA
jgi:hypothetical protein